MAASFSRREILGLVGGLSAAVSLRAQEEPVFSTDVKVVNVLATVRNKTGALVGNLGQDDFALFEDGRPQIIRYFARESNLPLTLGLLVDTSGSQRRVLDAERGACLRFLDQVVREKKDQVFILQFDTVIQVRQALTSSVGKLDDALAYVDSETMNQVRMRNGGGTLLYDAVTQASEDTMKKQTGRKALIVLSDGVDFGSGGDVKESVDAAQRADTLVYSILYSDSGAYGAFGGPDGKHVLQQLSKETGGSFFEVTKKQPVDKIFEILEEELRTQYSIGYSSDKPVTISEFRTIELSAKQKNLVVQARHQYWAQR
jgi:VWFA-related protein